MTRCSECHRPLPRKKITVRVYVDGVKIFPDGRERCLTKASWLKRKQELFDKHRLDNDIYSDLAACSDCHLAGGFHQLDADHIVKRFNRDDRLSNLRLLCNAALNNCHGKRHDEFKRKSA